MYIKIAISERIVDWITGLWHALSGDQRENVETENRTIYEAHQKWVQPWSLCHCTTFPLACLVDCISEISRTTVFLISVLVPCSRWLNGRDGCQPLLCSCCLDGVYKSTIYRICAHTPMAIFFYVHCPGEMRQQSTNHENNLVLNNSVSTSVNLFTSLRCESVSQVPQYFPPRQLRVGLMHPHFPREIREFILRTSEANVEDRNPDWKTTRSWK